jgi:hypothetical protein
MSRTRWLEKRLLAIDSPDRWAREIWLDGVRPVRNLAIGMQNLPDPFEN